MLKTAPEIARKHGFPEYSVQYVVTRLGITPAMKVSNRFRLFDTDAEKRIVAELKAIKSRRAG